MTPPPGVHITYFKAGPLSDWLYRFREARNPLVNVMLLGVTAWVIARSGARLVTNHHYDAVYALGGPISGLAGILLKLRFRLPLITHFLCTYNFTGKNSFVQNKTKFIGGLVRLLARVFYNYSDALIGMSPALGEDAVRLGVSVGKCHWAFTWADQSTYKPLNLREELRRKWGIKPGEFAFLYVGRFDSSKHVDRLIDALSRFRPSNAVVLFAGSGVLEPELRALEGFNPKVRVFGTRPPKELAELYNASDVLLWGSIDVDYPGLVVIEALSSGLPVITSSITMNAYYEGESVRGKTAPGDFIGAPRIARLYFPDRAGITHAILESIARRDELQKLRLEAAEFARQQFGVGNGLRTLAIVAAAAHCAPPTFKVTTCARNA